MSKLVPNRDDFITKTVLTRNFLTHHSIDDELKLIPDKEFSSYVNKLSIILLACILLEIKIPPENIIKALRRNRRTGRWL